MNQMFVSLDDIRNLKFGAFQWCIVLFPSVIWASIYLFARYVFKDYPGLLLIAYDFYPFALFSLPFIGVAIASSRWERKVATIVSFSFLCVIHLIIVSILWLNNNVYGKIAYNYLAAAIHIFVLLPIGLLIGHRLNKK